MNPNDIAIIGLAAHLPSAPDAETYWQNLLEGVESVHSLTEAELLEAGVSPAQLSRPDYVRAASTMDGVFDFDAEFFGLSPKEAGVMDPQHRHFLMTVWEAMEDAGHVPQSFDGAIGIFAGCGQGSYFTGNVMTNPDLVREVGPFLLRHTGNDKDFLTTRASYVFNLRGPSVNVQTACSTSLVATHLAVQHLLSGECDMALAGGSTIEIPHGRGYVYHEGEVLSPDGHCRAFDHRSRGTVFGSGAGVVVMRRVADALDDGDHIYALIRGSAVNNDGARKVGYLAPSVDGQAACVTEALAVADVDPGSIGFVECHGTGTPMGDPIEVAALAQAFRSTDETDPLCRLGSVKTNIGHLDTAAGVAGLIKATLALRHRVIPPTINFEKPNPNLELDSTPFVVNDENVTWERRGSTPRRAAVNSLGVGGTNAFVVLEEADAEPTPPRSERWRLVVLSARTKGALDDASQRLADHLRRHPDVDLADVEWTLQRGRHHFEQRRVLAARTASEAIELLEARSPRRIFDHAASQQRNGLTFMFPGGGAQYPRMAAGLYRTEPTFAHHVDEGLRLLADTHGLDLREQLLGDLEVIDRAALDTTTQQLPLIFIVEYALSQLLMSWGIQPTAMIGHSLGEKTAACIAGTISFEDCLGLIVCRAEVVTRARGGALTVPLGPEDLEAIVDELGLDIAVVNTPDTCVVSGATDVLATLADRLRQDGVEVVQIPMNVPPHSRLLEPGLDDYRSYLESISLHAPSIPWVSGRTGTWITDEQAVDPSYWVAHLRHTIVFSDAVATLAEDPERILVEVGPGRTLSSLVRAHPAVKTSHVAIPLMRHADDDIDDNAALLSGIGRIWAAGGDLDTDRLFEEESPRRIPLPTYAFQKQTYFIAPGTGASTDSDNGLAVERLTDEDRWAWKPVWRSLDREEPSGDPARWLVLVDRTGFGDRVVDRLRARGDGVVVVRAGDAYRAVSDDEYVISPELGAMDYEALMHDLVRADRVPDRVAHLALLAVVDTDYRPGSSFFHRNQELGFQSLVHLAQAWESSGVVPPLHLSVATVSSRSLPGSETPRWPEQSTVLGPVSVLPREFAGSTASTFDLSSDELAAAVGHRDRERRWTLPWLSTTDEHDVATTDLLDEVVDELVAPPHDQVVAIRGDRRFVNDIRHVALPHDARTPLRDGAVVLITGGLGGIGLTLAEQLHRSVGSRLALFGRSALPPRSRWDELEQRLGAHHPTVERLNRVRALEDAGAEVLLVTGDVTDPESVGRALDEVRSRFGGLDAVVHAAGIVDDALMVAKSPTEMDDVLAPKVYGTLVLDHATAEDDLDLFVVFSSTSTVTAPMGQVDYVSANAFLNAYTEARAAEGAQHVRSINWGVWNDVGMAVAAVEERDGAPEESQTWQASHPLFEEVTRRLDGRARIRCRWHADTDWVLDDHRIESGEALLPGAAYPELARAALAELGVTRPFEVRGLTFLRPLAAPASGVVEAEVVMTPDEQGYRFELRERVTVDQPGSEGASAVEQQGWRTTGTAGVLLHELGTLDDLDLEAELSTHPTRDAVRTRQQDHLRFGRRWDVIRRVQRGSHSSLAWLSLDDDLVDDVETIGLHPALFDLGTGFAMDLIDGYTGDRLWVPLEYQRIRVFDRIPSSIVARATATATSSQQSGFASFDVDLCDLEGRVLVRIDGFTIKRLDGPLELGTDRRVLASEVELELAHGAGRQLSLSESALRDNLSHGIRPEEGQRLFQRALSAQELPVVYLSSMDLHDLRHQSEAIAAVQTERASSSSNAVFSRPQLNSDFVAPRNDIEEQLVSMWQELLGIDEVGVQDDFFDLGGHSLIAVRLFAQVKRTFSVEFPISVLVEAPTIEACAAMISGALPDDGTADSDATSMVSPRPRYRHLVAMHPGDGTDTTPFFLVAGMFGNVLNLRHLAHQIGSDRPFYGVQARGLFGGDAPHESFEEMARDYLAEVREVQPHGPYLLGGFSGGGYTALEMARELRAAGEEVALLVMLDTPIPHNPPLTVRDRIKIQLDGLKEDGPAYVSRWARERLAWERQRRRGVEAPTDENVLHSTVIEAAFYGALGRYELEYYPGVITLFRPKLVPSHILGPDRQINFHRRFLYHDNGWSPYCDRVDVTEVPGDHDSMVLEPAVRVLTNHIRTKITEADRSEVSGSGE